jgi:NADH:ubiquinone oxidoreductase subunit E
MLQDIQDRFRHIPKTALEVVCADTGVPEAFLYHIATFYKAFSLEPRGEMTIQVCMGTTCHVKGSSRILDAFERELGIAAGKTTEDGRFSLEPVACLGACSIAPVVKFGDDVVGNVQAKDVARWLKRVSAKLAARRTEATRADRGRGGAAGLRLQGHAYGLHRHRLRRGQRLHHPREPRARARGAKPGGRLPRRSDRMQRLLRHGSDRGRAA